MSSSNNNDSLSYLSSTGISEKSFGNSLRSDILRSIGEEHEGDLAVDDEDDSHHNNNFHDEENQVVVSSSFRHLLRRGGPRRNSSGTDSAPYNDRLSLRDIFLREPAEPPRRPSPTPKQKKVRKALLARGKALDMTATTTTHDPLQRSLSGILYPRLDDSNTMAARRYRQGEKILLRCGVIDTPVNRFGFPQGYNDMDLLPEEQRGPYAYVIAEVEQVHFEEIHPYYTLRRLDTYAEQRADADIMVHIRTKRGEAAAMRAASIPDRPESTKTSAKRMTQVKLRIKKFCKACGAVLALPFLWFARCCAHVAKRFQSTIGDRCLAQAKLFLYGLEPYILQSRCTMVNVMVFCSIWFVFMDTARLAFIPPFADHGLAMVSMIIWIALVLELAMEAFVRPDKYRKLIETEKAYYPQTMRYINGFQLMVEAFSLALYTAEFLCIFQGKTCSQRFSFSLYNALLMECAGSSRLEVLYGSAYMALIRLRIFGLVRHWNNMWLNAESRSATGEDNKRESVKSASNIGTAILSTNSYNALIGSFVITGLFPMLLAQKSVNPHSLVSMTKQLQAINLLASDDSNATCSFLDDSINSWVSCLDSKPFLFEDKPNLLSLNIEPIRCGIPNICEKNQFFNSSFCDFSLDANFKGVREGSIVDFEYSAVSSFSTEGGNQTSDNIERFSVAVKFNQSTSIQNAAFASLLLQVFTLALILVGLSIMRNDAEALVLGPLRKMLGIVAHYSKNPLTRPRVRRRRGPQRSRISGRLSVDAGDDSDMSSFGDSSDDDDIAALEVGSFETEQLITAVAKITDLLRKCWGVAGADIISTNLATQEGALTEVFNPTVPGRSVYALFGFAAIGGFGHAVRNLGGDIMPLINDIAAVLHGEVARWGFGESGGECNKNLGGAFLMVYRIGLVNDVIEKLEQATDVVFSPSTFKSTPAGPRRRQLRRASADSGRHSTGAYSSNSDRSSAVRLGSSSLSRRKVSGRSPTSTNAMGLSLKSLPGISIFADRAVIGMLKSFAGINRDHKILSWNDDFRLGAGVGAFRINMALGLDAGWAVEGAVGSEYKIDATYLSPHVNMASRMTTACKQYDVTMMLSQSVQELLSEVAQSKLRHVDTVTVKGSSVKQNIYTYDAKARGVDFFLYSKSEDQADFDADRYSPNIWNSDADLLAMRQHITDAFIASFTDGHKDYLRGDWPSAMKKLEQANSIMFQNAVDEGYLEDEFDALGFSGGVDIRGAAEELKRENGDGPCMYLINFMKSYGGKAPSDWAGWHPLTRK